MEFIGFSLIILTGATIGATVRALRSDGRGHTPPVRSEDSWSAHDLPSVTYALRIF